MSRHEGVSCDSCLKSNFRGKRYKCLICYDYDLCSTCYEAGATTTRHTADHPMQCILTRNDFDLYYGGEALTAEQPQSFSCPYCGKMGFTETTLQDHVTADHADASTEVVCPICAAHPGGDPNYVTDDFAEHLTLQHRTPRGEFDEPTGIRHVRRIPHPGRGVGGTRTRRANMHFSSGGSSLAGLSPGNRDTMDPIAELLSQLSSVRSRAAATQSVSSQLQQLEMQLQSTRQQLERLPSRRQVDTSKNNMTNSSTTGSNADSQAGHVESSNETSNIGSPFLLARCMNMSEESEQSLEQERVDRSIFVQELLLSSLTEQLHIHEDMEDLGSMSDSLHLPTAPLEAKESVSSASQNSNLQNSLLVAKPAPLEKSNHALYVISQPSGVGGGGGGGGGASVGSHSRGNVPSGAPVYHGVIPGSPGQYNPLQSSNPIPGLAGAGIGAGNPHPLPGRPLSGGRERDTRVNPAAVKKTMFKQLSTSQTSDREPPPH